LTLLQTVSVVIIALILLTVVLVLIRNRRISERYALLWIVIALALLTVPYLHDFYVGVAGLVGIKNPESFFFFFSILGLVMLCLQFTVVVSPSYKDRKTLTQQLALLSDRVRRLETKLDEMTMYGDVNSSDK
jgi:hypothetical protein